MKFYFCETCGKRLTEHDLERGIGRDKKLKGVYCANCAEGVMTMETVPLSNEDARTLLAKQKQDPAARRSPGRKLPPRTVPPPAANTSFLVGGVLVAGLAAVLFVVFTGERLGSGQQKMAENKKSIRPRRSHSPTTVPKSKPIVKSLAEKASAFRSSSIPPRSSSRQEQLARAAFEQAEKYVREHPGDLAASARAYASVAEAYPNTKAGAEAFFLAARFRAKRAQTQTKSKASSVSRPSPVEDSPPKQNAFKNARRIAHKDGGIPAGQNMIENSSAEKINAAGKPLGWNVYEAAPPSGAWGTTDRVARTGKRSAFLTLPTLPKGAVFAAGLIAGRSNGYTGVHAYAVQPNAVYLLSGWIRGKGFRRTVSLSLWGFDQKGNSRDRKLSGASLVPKDKWMRCRAAIRTGEHTRRVVPVLFVYGKMGRDFDPGATLYLDDVVLRPAGSPQNPGHQGRHKGAE